MTIPNIITTTRLPLHLLTAILLYIHPLSSLLTYLLNIALDKADGIYSRKYHQTTDFGKYYDIAVDRAIQTTMLVLLIQYNTSPPLYLYLFLLILTRDFLLTGIRQFAAEKNLFLKGSIYGKSKAAFEMTSIYLLFLQIFLPAPYHAILSNIITSSLLLTVVVGFLSLYKYLKNNYKLLSQNW
jgi:CDP-diacylglycerol--glycerol-3-phosphate 3-phosphatidyltransferase